jgi:hypothetical protein
MLATGGVKSVIPPSNLLKVAKHLDAGNPLEPLLPLNHGNIIKELG